MDAAVALPQVVSVGWATVFASLQNPWLDRASAASLTGWHVVSAEGAKVSRRRSRRAESGGGGGAACSAAWGCSPFRGVTCCGGQREDGTFEWMGIPMGGSSSK